MPFLPLDQAQVFDITQAPDGALLLPISYREIVLKARAYDRSVYMELDGERPFLVRAINNFDHGGDMGIAVFDYVIEVDSGSAYQGNGHKSAGDLLVGDGWSGIYGRTSQVDATTLLLTGDRATSPRAGYRSWRIVHYARNGERTVLFEKTAHPSE